MKEDPRPDTSELRRPASEVLKELVSDFSFRSLQSSYKTGLVNLLIALLLPFILTPLQLLPLISVLFICMFAVSWDVVSGYTGQLSFGHAFFFALGGYSSAILNIQHGVHPIPSIAVATCIAAIGGIIIGVPAARLSGAYLALVTLIAPIILLQLFVHFRESLIIDEGPFSIPIAPDGLGGETGLASPPQGLISTNPGAVVTVNSFQTQVVANYYLALLLLIVIVMSLVVITRSNTGDVLKAIRENERAVSASGINVVKFKLFSFILSGIVGGLSAAVFVHTLVGFAQPGELLNLRLSIDVIIYGILGGMGTITGPILGVLFFTTLIWIVDVFDSAVIGSDLTNEMPIILYAAALLVLVYKPDGLLSLVVNFDIGFFGDGDQTDECEEGGASPLYQVWEKISPGNLRK